MMKNFKKQKYIYWLGCVSLLMSLLISPVFAEYEYIEITGVPAITIEYDILDTKNVTNYSGVDRIKACNNCSPANTGDNDFAYDSKWSDWITVQNKDKKNVSKVNFDTLYLHDWNIPSGKTDENKIHEICIITQDNSGHNSTGTEGFTNISQPSCRNVYYDTAPPAILVEEVVLNNGNHWINTGRIPMTMTLRDNRAGLRAIYYNDGVTNGSAKQIPSEDIDCTLSNHPALGDGTWTCEIDTTLITNFNKNLIDFEFTVVDNVNNSTTHKVASPDELSNYRIYYDGVIPTGDITILNDGNDNISTNIGYLDYHIKDEISPSTYKWQFNSGIEKLELMGVGLTNGGSIYNRETIYVNTEKDPPKTVDGYINDYAFQNNCPAQVKMIATDKSGNVSEDIVSNIVNCQSLKVNGMTLTDIVHPGRFTWKDPFSPMDWNFNDKFNNGQNGFLENTAYGTQSLSNKYGPLQFALAGGNISFDLDYEWNGDKVNDIYGYFNGQK